MAGPSPKQTKGAQGGYALIAAVVAIAAFSYISLEVLAATRGVVAEVSAQSQRAKLAAAADAGIAAAIHGLGDEDLTTRWSIDGRPRRMDFAGLSLTIVVEDERGKIPINDLNEDQIRQMFSLAGISGTRLDTLVDSFQDWTDDDDERLPNGAEAPEYAPLGIKPRNGRLVTVDELIHVKGMDAALFSKIAPAATVFFGESGGFSPGTAQPFALAVMSANGEDSPETIERQRELNGERTAIDLAPDTPLTGRLLTVRVTASDGASARFQRSAIIELTGRPSPAYWIRWLDN